VCAATRVHNCPDRHVAGAGRARGIPHRPKRSAAAGLPASQWCCDPRTSPVSHCGWCCSRSPALSSISAGEHRGVGLRRPGSAHAHICVHRPRSRHSHHPGPVHCDRKAHQPIWVGPAAAFLPVIFVLGFATLALSPALLIVMAFQAAQRIANFAVSNPHARCSSPCWNGREVQGEERDRHRRVPRRRRRERLAVTALRTAGLELSAIALATVPVAAAWFLLALALGRAQERRPGPTRRLTPTLQPTTQGGSEMKNPCCRTARTYSRRQVLMLACGVGAAAAIPYGLFGPRPVRSRPGQYPHRRAAPGGGPGDCDRVRYRR